MVVQESCEICRGSKEEATRTKAKRERERENGEGREGGGTLWVFKAK